MRKCASMGYRKYFEGKVVLITGAGSGIGKALARKIAQCGPRALVAADLDVAKYFREHFENAGAQERSSK